VGGGERRRDLHHAGSRRRGRRRRSRAACHLEREGRASSGSSSPYSCGWSLGRGPRGCRRPRPRRGARSPRRGPARARRCRWNGRSPPSRHARRAGRSPRRRRSSRS
jgi:hypothetical protein